MAESHFQVVKQVVWKTFTVNLPQVLGKPLAQFYIQWFCTYGTFESLNNSNTPRLLHSDAPKFYGIYDFLIFLVEVLGFFVRSSIESSILSSYIQQSPQEPPQTTKNMDIFAAGMSNSLPHGGSKFLCAIF